MDNYWTIHVISTIVWAVLNAYLAGRNNRSRPAWFVISLPLGVIATLLIVMLRPLPAGRSTTTAARPRSSRPSDTT
ncbi:hypothetical protein [Arthrobacter sp. N1]|uniref:hypothetical protein n=1 Tax=Arthrobacter sp. N1 TaxID=619291 RepID=UPI003BB0D139